MRAGEIRPSHRVEVYALLAVTVVLAGVYAAFTGGTVLADFGGDNAIYLLTSTHYSPYSPPSDVAAHVAGHSPYPPLFPVLLALLGGGESLLAAHLVTTGFLVLSFPVLFAWLRTEGFGAPLALGAALVFAMLPGTYLQSLAVHSENLFLLLTLASLGSMARGERSRHRGWIWTAVLLAGAATLARAAGIALVAAVVVHLWRRRVPGRWVLSVLAVAPMAAWSWLGAQAGPNYFKLFASSYGTSDLIAIADALQAQGRAFQAGWASNVTGSENLVLLANGLGLLGLAGTAYRIYRGRLDGLFALLYLGLVFVWPYPAETKRLLFIAVPVVLLHGLEICRLAPRRVRPDLLVAAVIGFVGIQSVPRLAFTATRFLEPPPGLEAYRRHERWYGPDRGQALLEVRYFAALTHGMLRASELLPVSACLYSVKPNIAAYHARRISVAPPREELDDEAFHRELSRRPCRYFYFMGLVTPSYGKGMYPIERVEGEIAILDSVAVTDGRSGQLIAILAERRARTIRRARPR